jgi:hypothetical protein
MLGVSLYTLCFCTHRGRVGTAMYHGRKDMEEKNLLYRNLVAIRQGAYRYMGCAKRERLGTEILIVSAFSKQMPLF